MKKETIGLRHELIAGTEALLKKVMEEGRIVVTLPTLSESRVGLAKELEHLPDLTKAIRNPVLYSVEFSPALARLREETERKLNSRSVSDLFHTRRKSDFGWRSHLNLNISDQNDRTVNALKVIVYR